MSVYTLGNHHIDVWYWNTTNVDSLPLEQAEGLLDASEKQRQARLKTPQSHLQFTLGRYLLRTCLSLYLDIEPQQWKFLLDSHGKPRISSPPLSTPLTFNLSHTRGAITVAIGRQDMLGIDIENTKRQASLHDIAKRFYSPSEYQALLELPKERQRQRFFEYWTLKEAYVKARGLGIAPLFADLNFEIEDHAPARLHHQASPQDHQGHWHFQLFSLDPEHLVALAVCCEKPTPTVTLRHFSHSEHETNS